MLNEELLQQAFTNVATEELKKVVRAWIVFTAPKEVHDVIKEYNRLLAEQEPRP